MRRRSAFEGAMQGGVAPLDGSAPRAEGFVVVSHQPIGKDGAGIVPGQARVFPLTSTGAGATASVPIFADPRERGRALFCRAYVRGAEPGLGWSSSNALAVTIL